MSIPEADAQLPLKKRARRRLVGAIALAVLAAVVLPMVMDHAPQAPVQDVQIRIPGQDQAPSFSPKTLAATPADSSPTPAAAGAKAATPVSEMPAAPVSTEKTAEKPAEAAKPAAKPEKPAEKSPEKPAAAPEKVAKNGSNDAQRAAALLAGKAEPSAPAKTAAGEKAAAGEYVILIGAFANPANVKQLQTKLGELGLKVYTETLDSPQGKKTRVRAGPFPSRDAADKALEKMKRIGVNGVVAAKQ
ncbi:MAG: SPOR domain-containing protein [Rhodocyclaceae bacterium]